MLTRDVIPTGDEGVFSPGGRFNPSRSRGSNFSGRSTGTGGNLPPGFGGPPPPPNPFKGPVAPPPASEPLIESGLFGQRPPQYIIDAGPQAVQAWNNIANKNPLAGAPKPPPAWMMEPGNEDVLQTWYNIQRGPPKAPSPPVQVGPQAGTKPVAGPPPPEYIGMQNANAVRAGLANRPAPVVEIVPPPEIPPATKLPLPEVVVEIVPPPEIPPAVKLPLPEVSSTRDPVGLLEQPRTPLLGPLALAIFEILDNPTPLEGGKAPPRVSQEIGEQAPGWLKPVVPGWTLDKLTGLSPVVQVLLRPDPPKGGTPLFPGVAPPTRPYKPVLPPPPPSNGLVMNEQGEWVEGEPPNALDPEMGDIEGGDLDVVAVGGNSGGGGGGNDAPH